MDIADILVHVHPDLSEATRTEIEGALAGADGVISVHFSRGHPHELTIAYDPRAISSQQLLDMVRDWDEAATMIGL